MGSRLGIIGAGNMGHAIVRGVVEAGVLSPQAIVVAEIDPARREAVAALGCPTAADPAAALAAEQILLAVKPQGFAGLAERIGPIAEPRIVLSIMAGLHSRSIRAGLGPAARVIRVMPNTPCRIGAGVAAIALGEGAAPGDETLAVSIFDALGRTVMVNEADMHAVTGVSGSGPAYVFLLVESMERAAVEAGLDPPTAAVLVRQTVLGAARLLVESGGEPAALREAVTSPGGTTEAALGVMMEKGFGAIIGDAISAARTRGRELDQSQ